MPSPPELEIRSAGAEDARLLLEMIREFAEHVRMSNKVIATEERLRKSLFGSQQYAEVLLADWSSEPVGFAVFYHTYSTFRGEPGMFLEDLFVRAVARRRGIGRGLLVEVARIAKKRGCGRLEWSTLDWNEPAIQFYRHIGAEPHEGSTIFGLVGDALNRLAEQG